MNKLVKFLIIVVGGLVFFSVALVFVLFTVINPNRYRGVLENLVAQQSGLQLSIAGDMSWQFRPVFGLGIDDVRLRNPDSPQELASFSRISLRLDPAGLLRGQLNMQELLAENLHVNWIVDSSGQSNWPERRSQPSAQPSTAGTNEIPVAINIDQITVRNAGFMIQDRLRGINADIRNIHISSRNTNLDNQPFPLTLSMNLNDAATGRELPVSVQTTALIDMESGNIDLNDLQLSMSPLQITGNIQVRNVMDAPEWQAELSSNRFPLPHLLANFADQEPALPPPDQQLLAISRFDARGDLQNIRLEALTLELGDAGNPARLELEADIMLASDDRATRVGYELRSQHLDLDAWLATPTENTQTDNNGTASNSILDTALPLQLLNTMNIRGSHNIANLRIGGLQFTPANFGVVLEDGELALDTQSIGFYGGELDMLARLDGRTTPAQLAVNTELTNINSTSLTTDMPLLRFLNGRFDVVTDHRLSGQTIGDMIDSISGNSQLQISESTMNISLLKQVFSSMSVLSPSGDMASLWPDQLQIGNTQAVLTFTNGFDAQDLSVRLDNFDIAGTGGIDLRNRSFDYQMAFTILGEPAPQTIAINPDFQNVAWPVRCNAAFDDSPSRYCSPDMQRVRDVFAQIARGEVERRASEVIGEQIENVRNRLRNLFQ